jgi:hypothetical protein
MLSAPKRWHMKKVRSRSRKVKNYDNDPFFEKKAREEEFPEKHGFLKDLSLKK